MTSLYQLEHARGLHAAHPIVGCVDCPEAGFHVQANSPTHEPAPSSAPRLRSLESAFARVRARMVIDEPDEPEPAEPPCQACNGFGFVRKDVGPSHPDFGQAVPCDVCNQVAQRGHLRALASLACIPAHFRGCTLETFPQRSNSQQRLVLALREWVDDQRWLYLYGPPGRGKTGLAVALMRELAARGNTGVFHNVVTLLSILRRSYTAGDGDLTESALLDAALASDVLVLDDLGSERVSEWAVEKLGGLVNGRYEAGLRTIITSNHNLDDLAMRLEHDRLPSRIAELAEVFDLTDLPNLRTLRSLGSKYA